METKRTKVEVKYARTIQLKPYEPVVRKQQVRL